VALFIALNGAGILLATTFAIIQFDLSPWWYCAALAAWTARIGSVYRKRSNASLLERGAGLDCQETAERN
jgi:hypothetical protein